MKKICFISHSNPTELCGVSLYYKNLLNHLKNKNLDITWAYFGNESKKYSLSGLNYIEIKKSKFKIPYFENNFQIRRFLNENYFKVVFTTGGPWTWFYPKPIHQKLFHIYHGTVFYFNKNQLKRFSLLKRSFIYPLLLLSWIAEKPHSDVDQIINVSTKVQKQVENLYGEQNTKIIRTGVNLNEFKPRTVNTKHLYGLYVGGGGHYTKGLDRVIKLSKELHKLNNNYRLLVIGPDKHKVRNLLNEKFVHFLEYVPRDKMKDYYNKAKIFLCMSRYEGGAPTLVVGESMASGCLTVCSEDSQQEIIKDNINGLIISNFDEQDAKRILNSLKKKKEIINNSLNTIKELSLEKWSSKYIKLLLNSN